MKAHYRTPNGQFTFEVQSDSVKALFKEIAGIQEVFAAERTCGCCNSPDIRLLARQVDDYDFYELLCCADGCHARFSFGQAKKGGGLFPKRKDEAGNWLPNRGWSKFQAKVAAAAVPAENYADEPYRDDVPATRRR